MKSECKIQIVVLTSGHTNRVAINVFLKIVFVKNREYISRVFSSYKCFIDK